MISKVRKIGVSIGIVFVISTVVCLLGLAGTVLLCKFPSGQINELRAFRGCLASLDNSVSEGPCLDVSANEAACGKRT